MSRDTITALVSRFAEHLEEYRSPSYSEALLRQDFLNPFFEALGWDMQNKQGFSQTFRQVIHEDSLNVEGSTKAPDYCFQLGGRRVFFVEAKKPAADLKESIHPAYQLRRYAWSARLPVSILTDFEEFAVYDCRVKPTPADKPAAARVLYLPFNEYPARWDELTGLFSPEAIQKGAIEKYVGSAKLKRGTAQVDDAFLEEIEGWRELLPAPIAQRLKDGEATIADRYEEVTVLFADIVGFTPLSERMVPDDLVGLLNRIFTAFDRLADRHGLEKIKTIGDAYMVAGGLPQRRADHAQAVARMALDMQTAIAAFADPEGRPLQLRIGIHTGPAAAGVIGARKFIYDVWSDTVNTASRMESHSFPAKIQVTQETYGRLKDAFLFEDRGEIMIKGKGAMRTYFLCGIKVGVPSPSEALGSAGSSLAICAETSSGPEKRNPSKPVAGSS